MVLAVSVSVDSRDHMIAIKDAIDAALPAALNVYDYSTVPGTNGNSGTVPTTFVIVSVERRFNPTRRLTAQAGSTGWRISARCVASTVTNVGLLLNAVAVALNENRLTIDGDTTTPIQFESDRAAEYDSGKYAAYSIWTYAI